VLAEIISASAWNNPSYSYANDFISDLGVPGGPTDFMGHMIDSPLAWVMNAGFIVNGGLVALAAVLLQRDSDATARWQRRLMIGYGVGLTTAAFFHEAPSWMLPLHALGAALAMGGGNVATFLAGRMGTRLGMPVPLARAYMVVGAFGLLFFLVVQVLVMTSGGVLPHNIGTLERLAAYPLLLAELVGGLSLYVSERPARSTAPQPQ